MNNILNYICDPSLYKLFLNFQSTLNSKGYQCTVQYFCFCCLRLKAFWSQRITRMILNTFFCCLQLFLCEIQVTSYEWYQRKSIYPVPWRYPATVSVSKCRLTSKYTNSHFKLWRSHDRLIFTMWLPTPAKTVFVLKRGPGNQYESLIGWPSDHILSQLPCIFERWLLFAVITPKRIPNGLCGLTTEL